MDKELISLGRGKAFNHKKKGHESQVPKHATTDMEKQNKLK